MKHALFSSKDKSKKNTVLSAASLLGALRVKGQRSKFGKSLLLEE